MELSGRIHGSKPALPAPQHEKLLYPRVFVCTNRAMPRTLTRALPATGAKRLWPQQRVLGVFGVAKTFIGSGENQPWRAR